MFELNFNIKIFIFSFRAEKKFRKNHCFNHDYSVFTTFRALFLYSKMKSFYVNPNIVISVIVVCDKGIIRPSPKTLLNTHPFTVTLLTIADLKNGIFPWKYIPKVKGML